MADEAILIKISFLFSKALLTKFEAVKPLFLPTHFDKTFFFLSAIELDSAFLFYTIFGK